MSLRAAVTQLRARRRLFVTSTAIAAMLLLGSIEPPRAHAQGNPAPVRVASKIDTEGSLLGQLIIQTLQAGGIRTENRLQLGTTKIVRSALVGGEIDLYPEYSRNGAFFFSVQALVRARSRPDEFAQGHRTSSRPNIF